MLPAVVAALAVGGPLALRILAPPEYDPDGLVTVTAVITLSAPAFLAILPAGADLFSAREQRAGGCYARRGLPSTSCSSSWASPARVSSGAGLAAVLSYGVLACLVGLRSRGILDVHGIAATALRSWILCATAVCCGIALPADGPWLLVRGVSRWARWPSGAGWRCGSVREGDTYPAPGVTVAGTATR